MSKPRFQQIYIEITNICNLNCPFCVDTNRVKEYMSISNFKTIIDKIKDYTHSIYLHVKGEPLIHPNFEELLEILINTNINTKITTNGTKLDKFGDLIINNPNIHKVNISLQSVIYLDENKQKEYFKNLKKFLSKVRNTHIYLRNWALDNKEDEILKKYLLKLYPNSKFIDEELLSPFIHYSKQEKFDWPSINNDDQINTTCLGGKNQLGILVDGSVVLCCLDNNGDTIIGNIFKDQMVDILNSELYLNAVRKMPYFELCKKCTYRLKFKK
ncbi:MAG: radical SAM protein [Bacilli bacterium]|nr:radical SAM protein [Bacilli bacterium]